jgi:hypothetical protein
MAGDEERARDERAMLEEIARLPVEQVLAQTVSTLVTLGFARLGGLPDAPELRDLRQARLAIDAIQSLGPLLESVFPPQSTAELRAALAELQFAYAGQTGGTAAGQSAGPAGDAPGAAEAPPRRAPAGVPYEPSGPGPSARPAPPRPKIWTPRGDV